MIVPMKKIAVLNQGKDSRSTVEALRRLGVVHVEHAHSPQGESVRALCDDTALIDGALAVLAEEKFVKAAQGIGEETPKDWRFTCRHTIDLNKRLEHLEEYSRLLKSRIAEWERWKD